MSWSKQTNILTAIAEPSDELKALIADHRDDLARTRAAIELYSRQAERAHPRRIEGLLAVMAGEAANDVPEPELLELGQWVFEGQDEKWVSAHVDLDGGARLSTKRLDSLDVTSWCWVSLDKNEPVEYLFIGNGFDATNWQNSGIDRETVNDVDYLSNNDLDESVTHIDDILAQPNWLSESVPQVTDADLQLIFIKNLSEVLIQRMHSMDRFSEDDYTIGGGKLMPWDIVFDGFTKNIGLVIGGAKSKDRFTLCFITPNVGSRNITETHCWEIGKVTGHGVRTINEDELPAFRKALEAFYA